jgi:CRP/FNR family transcriptional regulator, cyclic AMP receptor protein
VRGIPNSEALSQLDLFRGLASADLDRLLQHVHPAAFSTGKNILTAEQPGEVVYVIVTGTVKVHVEQRDGSDVILAILGPGQVLGEIAAVDRSGRSASAVAMEDSTLLWIDQRVFWNSLETMPGMSRNLVEIFARRIRLANAQIQALARLDVNGRVAHQLLAFADAYGKPGPDGVVIPIRITQTEIGDMVGASRVRVNQTLIAFRQQRLISVNEDARIIIRSMERLADYV